MNILVTVGTTSFDPLVEAIDNGPFANSTIMQIADGGYVPKNSRWFSFDTEIEKYIDNADVVVCHAGAGSIFSLLERGIVPLVVPNTVRRDKHQIEIANWLVRERYAVVAMSTTDVNQKLKDYQSKKHKCVPFSEKRFFYQDELNQMIGSVIGVGH